ncbi:NUMOD4 motif-containing HNH endonuclease [Pseudomonas sp. BRM28]|uniref:NUMOD4 motif-containing HNH endonuclease n=1 Tax=Pseudomonas sp. BRM28 TaxID=2045201 RepID=UPI000CEE7D93|nr:NUMOD4 motif-containing HNH endonuclease [Pseudomonas sp. BRM28]PPS62678.1 hypothetical protein CR917_17580 [Pseudomonas sp. BRM28]
MIAERSERWAPIPGYPGYEASSLGRIRSFIRTRVVGGVRQPRILKQKPNKDGYLLACVTRKHRTVHRLVAMAFLGESDLPQVNHLNGIKADNRIENLEWCTISENVRHAIDTGLRVYGTGLQSRTHKGWVQAERGGFGLMLRGQRDMISIGMNPSVVTSCLKGRRRTHRGFTFSRSNTQL